METRRGILGNILTLSAGLVAVPALQAFTKQDLENAIPGRLLGDGVKVQIWESFHPIGSGPKFHSVLLTLGPVNRYLGIGPAILNAEAKSIKLEINGVQVPNAAEDDWIFLTLPNTWSTVYNCTSQDELALGSGILTQ